MSLCVSDRAVVLVGVINPAQQSVPFIPACQCAVCAVFKLVFKQRPHPSGVAPRPYPALSQKIYVPLTAGKKETVPFVMAAGNAPLYSPFGVRDRPGS